MLTTTQKEGDLRAADFGGATCLQRRDWLALVAVHSDSWLLAVAFYKGARLNKEHRYV
jgi:hypothetical protein